VEREGLEPSTRNYEIGPQLEVACRFNYLPRGARCTLARRSTAEHNRLPQIPAALRMIAVSSIVVPKNHDPLGAEELVYTCTASRLQTESAAPLAECALDVLPAV
jgi:hypothetical protein